MEAVVISSQEPQLGRCLEAIGRQTIPFSGLVHVDSVVPEAAAFVKALGMVKDEWIMAIGGDMVLYDNAVDTAESYIVPGARVGTHQFALLDGFLKRKIMGCCVYRTEAVRSVKWSDILRNDMHAVRSMDKAGWKLESHSKVVIGTHMDSPDEFQIFRRFFSKGVKNRLSTRMQLEKLYEDTGRGKYAYALECFHFGKAYGDYPGSHNMEFEKARFEEFTAHGRKQTSEA